MKHPNGLSSQYSPKIRQSLSALFVGTMRAASQTETEAEGSELEALRLTYRGLNN